MGVARKRLYAKFERSTWRNPTFRYVLTDDARWMWVHLLTTPRATKCPGLIEASALNLMEDLGWDRRGPSELQEHERIALGVQRTVAALEELAATMRDDGVPWILYSQEHRIVVVPRAVAHDLPANANIVEHWVKALAEYPDTTIKRAWVSSACSTLRAAFGKDDKRTAKLQSLHYGICRRLGQADQDSGRIEGGFEEDSRRIRGGSEEVSGRHSAGHREDSGRIDEQAPETKGESETVRKKKTEPSAQKKSNQAEPINISINNNSMLASQAGGDSDATAARQRRHQRQGVLVETDKATEPPKDFTPRQRAFFEALRTTEFYLRGKGATLAFDAVKDPMRLARNLGDADTFPLVDVGLVKRLGAWSFENRSKAKTDIAKFILNRARYQQERGTPRGQAQQPEGYRHGGDLAAKVRNTK